MRATVMYAAGDVRVETVPDAALVEPGDAVIRVTHAAICGSDLWPYAKMKPSQIGQPMGHEALGIVEAVGSEVATIRPGDVVIMPFAFSDGTCGFCRDGLQTSCVNVRFVGTRGLNGSQAEALRVSSADGTLFPIRVAYDHAIMSSLLALSDVMGTGHHAAVSANVGPGEVTAVIGDGAVGLCGVIAARRLGAEQIIILGRHPDRTRLARELGATDVVVERGQEAVERVKRLTGGHGAHSVLECVGLSEAMQTAIEITRPGGAIGRVGAPQHPTIPGSQLAFYNDVAITGGLAPTRAYIPELLLDVLEGRIEPGRVLDRTVDLEDVPGGYKAMADREAIKVMVRP